MSESVKFDSKSWPTYRSKFRVKAWQIQVEGAGPSDTITITIEGKKILTRAGDYIVELVDDGRLEHWTKDRFERELELEAAQGREIHLELDR